jgi:hypothetical protein
MVALTFFADRRAATAHDEADDLEALLDAEMARSHELRQLLEQTRAECVTPDLSEDVDARDFLRAVDCVFTCEETDACDGMSGMEGLLLSVCSHGWAESNWLMTEAQVNYENCRMELSW